MEGERTRRVDGVDFNFLILGRRKGKKEEISTQISPICENNPVITEFFGFGE